MNTHTNEPHKSVMLKEVLEALMLKENGLYVDCTFGAGGYSKGILSKINCNVIAIDQDKSTFDYASKISTAFPNKFELRIGNFRNINQLIKDKAPVDGIVYDLGVSSMQLDNPERGFSFNHKAALDMRMGNEAITAFDIVNNTSQQELADLIWKYGEEKSSRKIAERIIEERSIKPIQTTFELARIIREIVRKKNKIDPATKTFQAIRIAVNDELGALKSSLEQTSNILKPGARLVVVSFHGLEDKIIKNFFLENCLTKIARSKYSKAEVEENKPFRFISKKSIKPSREETIINPRARSARMRIVEKT